jgi:hypothetical protein
MTEAATRTDSIAALLTESWRAALGKPPSGADADFFRAGGDSLLIARIVAQLRKAGITTGPADFLHGRTFGGILARLRAAGPQSGAGPRSAPPGPVPLLPCQARWVANQFADPDHFGLVWVFRLAETTPDGREVGADRIEAAVRALTGRHEALRTRYLLDGTGGGTAEVLDQAPDEVFETVATADDALPEVFERGTTSHRLAEGKVVKVSWLPRQRLLQLAVHHLTVDGYSLSVLADDLEDLFTGPGPGRPAAQPRDLAADLAAWSASAAAEQDAARWADLGWNGIGPLPTDTSGPALMPSMTAESVELSPDQTAALRQAARDLGRPVDLLVLAAAGKTAADYFGLPAVSVDAYHHGRDGVPGGHDISGALGYLQSTYPVVVQAGPRRSWLADADADLARVPAERFGFDALRFAGRAGLAQVQGSGIRLNFRSRMNELLDREGQWLRPAEHAGGSRRSSRQHEPCPLMLEADLIAGQLVIKFRHSRDQYRIDTIRALASGTAGLLTELGDLPGAAGTPR